MVHILRNKNIFQRNIYFVVLFLWFQTQLCAQDKTFNVYGGSTVTAVFGNQSNYYQPTEVLNQIDYKISKILKKFNLLTLNIDSIKMNSATIGFKSFLDQLEEYSIAISLKDRLIDSLNSTLQNKDKDLAEAKNLIAQSQAVNKSAKILLETNTLTTIEQDNRKIFSFKESDIKNEQSLISVFYLNENKSTAVVRKFNRYGFVNRSGNIVINFKYEYAENFENNLALVVRGEKYGFIDSNDVIKIPFVYDFALSFRKGKALVSIDKNWFFINENGKNVSKIKPFKGVQIESVKYLKNQDRICIQCKYPENSFYQFAYLLNGKGKYIKYWVFPRRFYFFEIQPFKRIYEIDSTNNYKIQYLDDSFGMVNNRVREIPNTFKYDFNFTFDINNYAIVKNKILSTAIDSVYGRYKNLDYKYNIINTDGIEMLNKPYQFIDKYSLGTYLVKYNLKLGLLDSTLNEKVKCEYDGINKLTNRMSIAFKLINLKNNSTQTFKSYGVIDENGFSFIPFYFKKIEFIENRYFIVSFNDIVCKLELFIQFDKIDVKCITNCDEYYNFILLHNKE